MVVYDHCNGVELWGVGLRDQGVVVVVCDLGEEMKQTESQSVNGKCEKVGGKSVPLRYT